MGETNVVRIKSLFLVFILFLLACSKPPVVTDIQRSCLYFVQQFYDWYVPIAYNAYESGIVAADIAMDKKSNVFGRELLELLRKERLIRERSTETIEGLDFDPFLSTQDPWPKYIVDGVVQEGGRYFVYIYGVEKSKKSKHPNVIVELELSNDKWTFVNFHYGKNASSDDNLLRILRRICASSQSE